MLMRHPRACCRSLFVVLVVACPPAAADVWSEHNGVWIGPIEREVEVDIEAVVCELEDCTAADRRRMRQHAEERAERLRNLPRRISIERFNSATVGDLECSWEDKIETYDFLGGEESYTVTLVQCDGFQTIRFGPGGGDHEASVRFGDLDSIYMTQQQWQAQQKEKRQRDKDEDLQKWGE